MSDITKATPTFAELVKALGSDTQEAFKNDKWNSLLAMPPHASWLKKHPVTKGDYLPIDKVEHLLTYIYQKWKIEVIQVQQLFQSIQVTVRLHVHNPLTGEWESQDGIGASPIQTDQGASASDLSKIKNSAVQIAAPAAESYAIKDAAEKLGNIFGKNLNRKDTIMFSGAYSDETAQLAPQPIKSNSLPFNTAAL